MTYTPRHIGGLDVSTARIGYATPRGELLSLVSEVGAEDPSRRLSVLRQLLERAITTHPPLPELIAIEGYSLAMMTVTKSTTTGTHKTPTGVLSKIRLGEVGAVARLVCFDLAIPFLELPPSSIKRFATGRGNASKSDMIAAAIREGVRGDVNDDEADAYFARRMTRAAHGRDPITTDAQADAIANLTW